MKFTIDSETVELPASQSFNACCQTIQGWLLERNRSMTSCKIDGKMLDSSEDADRCFQQAQHIEIESLPLHQAILAAVSLHCAQFRQLEEKCETLVTDCLLADPLEIVKQWQDICQLLNAQMAFLPSLAFVLTDDQISNLVDKECVELNEIMQTIATIFPKADVVAFSDILEMRLLPWLKKTRELFQTALQAVENLQLQS